MYYIEIGDYAYIVHLVTHKIDDEGHFEIDPKTRSYLYDDDIIGEYASEEDAVEAYPQAKMESY